MITNNQVSSLFQEVEQESLRINNPVDPRMDKIYFLYALIQFKEIENLDPFADISAQAKVIEDFIEIGLEVSENNTVKMHLYSLYGDLNALQDQFRAAQRCYAEALKLCQLNHQKFDLLVALIKISLISNEHTRTVDLLQEVSSFITTDTQRQLISDLHEEFNYSKLDIGVENIEQKRNAGEQRFDTSQKKPFSLGIFGSVKRNLPDQLEFSRQLKQI